MRYQLAMIDPRRGQLKQPPENAIRILCACPENISRCTKDHLSTLTTYCPPNSVMQMHQTKMSGSTTGLTPVGSTQQSRLPIFAGRYNSTCKGHCNATSEASDPQACGNQGITHEFGM